MSQMSLAKINFFIARVHEGYMVLIHCLFYYLDITTTSFTKGKRLLMLENAYAFSRNLDSHKRRRTKLNSESMIQFMQRLDSRTLILSLLVMFQVL